MQAREARVLEPRCCLFLVACKLDLLQLNQPPKGDSTAPVPSVATPPNPQRPGLVRRSLDLAGHAVHKNSGGSNGDGDDSSGEDELAINRDDFAAYAAGIHAIPVAVSAKSGEEGYFF